ncbi:hypothetical protein EVAR_22519_1 [Eumeta japonica]|uniref:Uncharacterized protein n=1 Tax=Eumeta variegata TaxID=151549 RepID=A0A4C1U755_EUMVA|nr:hypothetical protein EVAR_22519_1 [Eumeta japonica]
MQDWRWASNLSRWVHVNVDMYRCITYVPDCAIPWQTHADLKLATWLVELVTAGLERFSNGVHDPAVGALTTPDYGQRA